MRANYQEKILTFLRQSTEPIDVEKIRTACGIGNWNTALTHSLDLLIQGKIEGQKTSKGWIFWTQQETQLEPWQEAIGNYKDLKINEDKVTLTLTHTIRNLAITFPKDTPEAQTLIQTLKNTPKGTKIAILKTDIPEKPIAIRILTEATVAQNSCLWLLLLRKMMLRRLCLSGCLSRLLLRKRGLLILRYMFFCKGGC